MSKIKQIIEELVLFANENNYEVIVVDEEDESKDINKIIVDLAKGKLLFE